MSDHTVILCSFYGPETFDYMRMAREILAPHCEVKTQVVIGEDEEESLIRLSIEVDKWNATSASKAMMARMSTLEGHVINMNENGEELTFVFNFPIKEDPQEENNGPSLLDIIKEEELAMRTRCEDDELIACEESYWVNLPDTDSEEEEEEEEETRYVDKHLEFIEEVRILNEEICATHNAHYENDECGLVHTENPIRIYHLFSNGELTSQPGGLAYMARIETEHTRPMFGYDPADPEPKFILPMESYHMYNCPDEKVSYAILTAEEAIPLCNKMIRIYNKYVADESDKREYVLPFQWAIPKFMEMVEKLNFDPEEYLQKYNEFHQECGFFLCEDEDGEFRIQMDAGDFQIQENADGQIQYVRKPAPEKSI